MTSADQHVNDEEKRIATMKPITLTPVGIVRSEIRKPMLRADEDGLSLEERNRKVTELRVKIKTLVSELIFAPQFVETLEGIEGFSHILVLYWPHLVPPDRRNLQKVHPMGRKDIAAQGIFATCSPARPNPVLVTAARLLERTGATLRVRGLEAVDGSPILDIKPYNPGYYRIDNPLLPEWMQRLHAELDSDC